MKKKALAALLAVVLAAGLLPGTARAADGADKVSTVKAETLVEPIYDEVGSFGYDENGDVLYAAVRVGGKWGYIDRTGKMVIEPRYDYAASFQEGVALVAKQNYHPGQRYNEKTGEYDEVEEPDGYQLCLLSADGRETALQRYSYSTASDSYRYEDYIIYNVIWDYELYDNVTVNPIDATWGCHDGVVYAGYPYLPDGTPIVPRDLASLLPSGHTYSSLYIPYYSPDPYDNPVMWGPCVNGVIPMRIEYYWEDLVEVYDEEADAFFDEFVTDRGAICFYMDPDGNITRTFPVSSFVPNDYDGVYAAYAPDETGLAVVNYGGYDQDWKLKAGYGAMRADGTFAVPPVCSNFRYFLNGTFFAQGLWTVSRDGEKWGAVDADGVEVIPLEYDAMGSFNNDLSAVQKDGLWYYIDMKNNVYRIGTPEGGVADRILIASHFSDNIAAVYDGERAYCIANTPVDGVLPAIQGTEELALSAYFPNYEEYLETGVLGLVFHVGEYAAIERDGKWGFLKLTFELENVNPFEDIHLGDYYYDSVLWAVENGITTGDGGDTTFNPSGDCTRAQIVTFLWRAYGEPEPTMTESPFTDVKPGAYYYKAVLWAYENGIANGTGDGARFNPSGTCSRKDAVTFLYRAADSPAVAGGSSFDDVAEGKYYTDAVTWAAANGIATGTGGGAFSPDRVCKRNQVVTFLYRQFVLQT